MLSPPIQPALVHDSERFDGMRAVFLNYVEALRRSGISPDVYTCVDPSRESEFSVDGLPIRGWRIPGGGSLEKATNRLFGTFTRRLAKLSGSPLHVHSVHLAPVCRRRGDVVLGIPDLAKRTTRYYAPGPTWLHNWLLRFLPQAASVVTYTEWGRRDIERVTGYPIERIVAAPPFAATPRSSAEALAHPDPPTERAPWSILYIAVDRPHKNLSFFLRLLASLDRRFRGIYVGRPTLEHRQEIAELGLNDRLTISERPADLTSTYRRAQILVFPSMYEGFGVPLLEAMSHGIPVIASRSTCIPEVVGSGGMTLDLESPEQWTNAVLQLMDIPTFRAAQRASISRAGEFTPSRTAGALERAYALAQSSTRHS